MSSNDILHYGVNKAVPDTIRNQLEQVKGDRAFLSVSEGGVATIFIVVNNLLESEIEALSGRLLFTYTLVHDVPIVMLDYIDGSMTFDIPAIDKYPLDGNALNIIAVEENGYIVKNMRILGLEKNIAMFLGRGMEMFLRLRLSRENILKRVNDIFSMYSSGDLRSMRVGSQMFGKTKTGK